MAKKNSIPKKIAGYKVPKALRKSSLINGLLGSDIGRGILANALTAAAGAAAAVLVEEHDDVADAADRNMRKGRRALGTAGTAMSRAAEAAIEAVKSSTRDALPKRVRKDMKNRPSEGAVH
ncbi:hypothetical protein RJJ65_30405 [Rhizobium hidalgonense]|uniref:Uncharacterized protein n=1 Tax=Rhizobium hidalgonense TaxID=1538159 RepID=A0A2A6KAJ0_9HYPH|nr:hypothetical protein [Rhizobium hidalgonense]MDR9776891.1 hypothetical protein [Rhizobium hidalgonense]MDR9813934.1 hypothetical protein [Rhizobium hidalgonense]MDR9820748.1 hypothetical protein [Rhizobium hidalgonense]PDT21432.1 hypothetical protein CO674_22880 [Rhizobium hidalgonense]PON08090.1 hypothetical protein ATY29_08465 [Rhizobium hidalgonense]